jgi:murein DD-endopeptidase MepM/ murein hydrolase activator NlpD
MDIAKFRRCGIARAGLLGILAAALGACAEQTDPAPVFQRGAAASVFAPVPASAPALEVIVKRGQTLDGYAYTYHQPKSAIIAANGLHPPYELKAGQRLIIPGHSAAPIQQAAKSAVTPPVATPTPLPPLHAETLAPPQPATPPPAAASATQEVIPLDGPPPKEASAPPPRPASPQAALTPPQTIPLGPASPASPAVTPAPLTLPQPQANAAVPGGRFPWPVRGRVLASYGNTPGGGHNDGINIAAPRGTPVRSIDAGTVAYAGNEVKGYGNIVLIKHANGWISAYAHLDDVTVKPGDTITSGEVIAKVGDSGGVAEPQLHFELRRGKQPVDPKEFLAPSPSAAAPANDKAG